MAGSKVKTQQVDLESSMSNLWQYVKMGMDVNSCGFPVMMEVVVM
jgi:hypothetical protein